MRIQAAYQHLIEQLTPTHGDSEARAMARGLLDDLYDIKPPFRGDLPPGVEQQQLDDLLQRLNAGEPLQYLSGKAHFYGLKLAVGPGVLIPRPETEELVNWALALLEHREPGQLIDLCTGSGCIALNLKRYLYDWEVLGVDVSERALAFARQNAERHELDVKWHCSDMLDAAQWPAWGMADAILCNPPYIGRDEAARMGVGVLAHEPGEALFVTNEDSLQFYRVLAKYAQKYLNPQGWMLVEINEFYGQETRTLFLDAGFDPVLLRQDLQGKDRMLAIQKRKL